MKQPLDYQDAQSARRGPARHSGRRMIFFGLVIVLLSPIFLLAPLYLGRNIAGASVAGFGFLFACWGLSCMIHGVWDWLGKR